MPYFHSDQIMQLHCQLYYIARTNNNCTQGNLVVSFVCGCMRRSLLIMVLGGFAPIHANNILQAITNANCVVFYTIKLKGAKVEHETEEFCCAVQKIQHTVVLFTNFGSLNVLSNIHFFQIFRLYLSQNQHMADYSID